MISYRVYVCDITYDIAHDIKYELQDCVCLIAPYPNNPNPPETFDLASDFDMSGSNLLWYGRLQLLFRCTLCHTDAARDVERHLEVSLAFFNTFEPVELTPNSVMQRQSVPMLYDSASCAALPSLYLCHAKNVLGRVPMIPSFVAGNAHPTIPHSFRGGSSRAEWQTRSPTAVTAAASTKSTCGCGGTGGRRSERCRSGSAWKQGRSACARRGGGQPRRASAAGSRQRKRAWRAARAPRRRKAQHHCASLHLCWGSSELNRRLFWQTSSKFCGIPMTVSCVDLMLWLTVKSRCYRNP